MERRSYVGHPFQNITRPDVTRDQHIQADISSEYKGHLTKGESSFGRADLDSAEKHFAAALKTVHIPDSTAQQYQREVGPLCKLGDVYIKRGQQTGDGGAFVKAAALYNAAIARSWDEVHNGSIGTAIDELEKSFVKCILDIDCNVSKDNTQNHKKQLKELRDQIKLEMETIDKQLDPYIHDEHDPRVKETETKRAQAVRELFERIAQQRKELIGLLVGECIGLMGPPPCKYALIGLGSQATGLVTPYSDLEFATLVEEQSPECLVYFRNLTHYLHLKVVNLGETILPAVGIKSLNDFFSESPNENWYYDSVTPRGFAFDGSMPKASKTPLGRQGIENEQSHELICTPSNMVSILQNDITLYLKEGYHLASILRNPCLIAGDQGLIDTYMAITEKTLQAGGGKMAEQLAQETQRENIENYMYSNKKTITAKLIDVKKEIYRFPALAIECLALCSHIAPTTVWKMIEEMENQQVISPNNAHHLTVLTSISAELRLRTYIANGGQRENVSALGPMETILDQQESSLQTTSALKPVFHLPNEKQLLRYFHTAFPLKRALSKWSGKNTDLQSFSDSDFYDNSPGVQGMMYRELCKYSLAISYFHEAIKTTDVTDPEKTMLLLGNIGHSSLMVGDCQKAISYCEQALKKHGEIHGQSASHPDLIAIVSNLGGAWSSMGDQRKTISYYEQALQMKRSIYGQSTAHPDIAVLLNNLGAAWHDEGDYRKEISYYEQALPMYRGIYGESSAHPAIAKLLNNLGLAWDDLGEHRRAVRYYEQALQMKRGIYGQTTAHPDIAISLANLGTALNRLGDNRKAIVYIEQALKMYRSIYGQTTAHPDIATLLNNIGSIWDDLGDYRKTISYFKQALQMFRRIYGPETPHLDIAMSLNNIGSVFLTHAKDHMKAISYFDGALQIVRRLYGQSAAHPYISSSLNNLGKAWGDLGEHRKALSYYEQTLQMQRSIYGLHTAHPEIASSLNNMGETWGRLGEHRRALSYNERALQMYRSIYGPQTAHPNIVISLNNLGMVFYNLGDVRKANRTLLEALAMATKIHPENQNHPLIKTIERALAKI
ncbi:uncharacterized protein [Branchiostoma lanceolatum]